MPVDTPVTDLVRQLRRIGLRPPERLVERILEYGAGARDALLALATDRELLHEEHPACWGPIHGLRVLGELRDATTVKPLLQMFPLELREEQEQAPQVWAEDATQLIGHIGGPALEGLWAWFDDVGHHPASRAAASDSMAYVSVADPEQRPAIVEGFRQRLAESDDKLQVGFIISALSRMAAAEVYPQILEAYRVGRVEASFIAASDVRQLILGKGTPNLKCATHTLWERYDQHGPFPPQDA